MLLGDGMEYPEIDSLYKYRAFNINSLKSLISDVAWFATPASFNDPFDCGIYIDKNRMNESILDAMMLVLERSGKTVNDVPKSFFDIKDSDLEAFEAYRDSVYQLSQKIGVLSLSSINNDILMWGHYANSHSGFCIEYERCSDNLLGREAMPVVYQSELPSLTSKSVSSRGGELDTLWITKSNHWSYECEWRVIIPDGGKARKFPCRIKSITFGLKMTEENRFTIRKILEGRGVTFKEAVVSDSTFSINIRNIKA